MMIASTTRMLSVMRPSTSGVETAELPSETPLLTQDLGEKQLQLMPAPTPSMAAMLEYCLSPDKRFDHIPE